MTPHCHLLVRLSRCLAYRKSTQFKLVCSFKRLNAEQLSEQGFKSTPRAAASDWERAASDGRKAEFVRLVTIFRRRAE